MQAAAAAAAAAVDEPLVAVRLAPDRLEDARLVGGEPGGQGPLGLLAASGGEGLDVVFWVLEEEG